MIKAIASDLDGTLLNDKHEISRENLRAIELAKESGVRFMVATGRSFKDAKDLLKHLRVECDYIVSSGAEIRDPQRKIIKQVPMDRTSFETIFARLSRYPVGVIFCSDEHDYIVGTEERVIEFIREQARLFHLVDDLENLENTELYQLMMKKIQRLDSLDYLHREDIPIYKIFISSPDSSLVPQIDLEIGDVPDIASASSFINNLELTHIKAQKGIALQEYSGNLGIGMDEIMVLGDSMNDYSMLSMDFGATIAMENAMSQIKTVAKYQTKSNNEDGVAYAIHKMLADELDDLKRK